MNIYARELFLQKIRSETYKKIIGKKGGLSEWLILIGKKRGRLDISTIQYLIKITGYFNSSECFDDFINYGIPIPEHYDDTIELIREAKTFDELHDKIFIENMEPCFHPFYQNDKIREEKIKGKLKSIKKVLTKF